MSPVDRPRTHAAEACTALRRLAHATRHLEDPTEIYPSLGELTNGLASLTQSLHQIAGYHDAPASTRASVSGDTRNGRAASYQVAWELHRAAEMVDQVRKAVERSHEVEATIAYDLAEAVQDFPTLVPAPLPASLPTSRPTPEPGLSL